MSATVSFPLKYGDQITIRSTTGVDDGRRLTARFADIRNEPVALPRYVVFDNLPSRERTWRFLPTQAGVNLGDSVKFGDVVALGVVASAMPGNYSALGLKTIYLSARGGSTPRQVGFEYGVQGWEQWTIVEDPNNRPGSSDNTVSLGDAFALKTSFGDYLSWPQDSTDDSVLQTAAAIGAQQSWQTALDPNQTNPAPDGYMSYGDQFAIVASTDPCDRHRVAAKQVNMPGDPLPRYAVLDALANESNWRFMDSQGVITTGAIQFGDTVSLGMVAWVNGQPQTIYLSCRNGSTPRNIGLDVPGDGSTLDASELWTIIDPEVPTSTDYVTRGSAFALKSTFGDYMSQTISSDGVLQTASATGTTITWGASAPTGIWIAATPVIWDPQLLWHEDWLTVLRPAAGENTPPLLLTAAANAQYFSGAGVIAGPGFIVAAVSFQAGALSDLNRWIVERTDGQAVGINFGDQVYLSIKTYDDPAQPTTLYLKYSQSAGNDVQAGVAPQADDAAKWKVVNPDIPTSTASVRYGDKVALEGLSGTGQYLSAGGMSSTLDQSAAVTIGDAITAQGSDMPDMPALPSTTDNSAILLDVGDDLAQTMTVGMFSYFGDAGVALALVAAIFWPSGSGTDVWDLISARVNALIDEKIDQAWFQDFQNQYAQVQSQWQTYTQDPSWTTLSQMETELSGLTGMAMNFDHPEYTLPYFVAFASLDLRVLHELFIHSLDYPQDSVDPAVAIQQRRQALQLAITAYSNQFNTMRTNAVNWRQNQVACVTLQDSSHSVWVPPHGPSYTAYNYNPYIQDPFLQSSGCFRLRNQVDDNGNPNGDNVPPTQADIDCANRYAARMAEAFGSQLDALTLPQLLWSYLDPDCPHVPTRTSSTLITGPFGKLGSAEGSGFFTGGWYWNFPSVNSAQQPSPTTGYPELGFPVADQTAQPVPITGFAAAGTACILGYQIAPLDPISPGESGPGFSEVLLAQGERFVVANGCEGSQCQALSLTTNQGNVMKSGNFDPNATTWSNTLPADTHPFWTGLSGSTSDDDGLDQVYLHWQYDRWQ
jgi:hypothetical protein